MTNHRSAITMSFEGEVVCSAAAFREHSSAFAVLLYACGTKKMLKKGWDQLQNTALSLSLKCLFNSAQGCGCETQLDKIYLHFMASGPDVTKSGEGSYPGFQDTASTASASGRVGVVLDIHHQCGLDTCFLTWRKRKVIRSSKITHFDSCQEMLLLQSDLHIRMDLVTDHSASAAFTCRSTPLRHRAQ